MSKTTSDIASLLSANSSTLFDRYINFTLKEKQGVASAHDLKFVTPSFGMKPHITVSGTLNTDNTVNSVTLSVINISEYIDCNRYGYIEIEAGYRGNGQSIRFEGMIINCYMSKPNPNGELVITCATTDVTNVYSVEDPISVTFLANHVNIKEMITTCLTEINKHVMPKITCDYNITPAWLKEKFDVNRGTYTFKSAMDCISWINSLISSHIFNGTYQTNYGIGFNSGNGIKNKEGLNAVMLRFDVENPNKLVLSSIYEPGIKPVVRALSAVSSAYISGEYGMVTAPFIPDIKPGEFIYVNPAYFKTRVNLRATDPGFNNMMENKGSIWSVVSAQFTFSTATANNMIIQLTNVTGAKVGVTNVNLGTTSRFDKFMNGIDNFTNKVGDKVNKLSAKAETKIDGFKQFGVKSVNDFLKVYNNVFPDTTGRS